MNAFDQKGPATPRGEARAVQTPTSAQPYPLSGAHTRTPPMKWRNYPNLQRRPHAPNAGRGRLQRQIRRAFMAGGDELTSSQVYDWCMLWPVDKRASQAQRWSVLPVLRTVADPIGRAPTAGRPWIWRMRSGQPRT